jgi:8-hydroxy-5-deazaflavin:NADPH oxidoreductase
MRKIIAIIGAAGNIGSAIALGLAAAGYRVLLTDDIEQYPHFYLKLHLLEGKIRFRVPEADVDIVLSAKEASWEADVILLVIPDEAHAEVASRIKEVVTGKVVINLEYQLNGGHGGPVTSTNSGELAHLLPHSKVVKATSRIFADGPGESQVTGTSVDVLVAGDDDDAVSTVMKMVEDTGYHPLRAGTLDGSPRRTGRSHEL